MENKYENRYGNQFEKKATASERLVEAFRDYIREEDEDGIPRWFTFLCFALFVGIIWTVGRIEYLDAYNEYIIR